MEIRKAMRSSYILVEKVVEDENEVMDNDENDRGTVFSEYENNSDGDEYEDEDLDDEDCEEEETEQ